MSLDEHKLMKKFRDTESCVLKAVRTGVIQSITVAKPSVNTGTQLGPNEMLTPEEATRIITQLNLTVDDNPPVPTMPTDVLLINWMRYKQMNENSDQNMQVIPLMNY
jgi:hypothetical protein